MTSSPRQSARPSTARNAGFTLIEMMVTLGIVMLALGLMVPSLTEAFKNRKLSSAGNIIIRQLNLARNNAVSRKQVFAVVFVRGGVLLFKEPKGADPGGFDGGVESLEPDGKGLISYALRFAGSDGMVGDEIPEINTEIEAGRDLTDSEDIYLRFLPDGTVDFNRHQDVSSVHFEDSVDADILISQKGLNGVKGFIDIRNTGRFRFKVEEVGDDE